MSFFADTFVPTYSNLGKRRSLARSRAARFARPNRRACPQASSQARFIYVRLQHSMKALFFFSRIIILTSRRLVFRAALMFFEYLLLIKITLRVHLCLE